MLSAMKIAPNRPPLHAHHGMRANELELVVVERALLVEHRAGHDHLAHVVQLSRHAQVAQAGGVEIEHARDLDGESRDAGAVEMRLTVVRAQHVEQVALRAGAAPGLAGIVGGLHDAVLARALGRIEGRVGSLE